ncbi:MAG TPA: methyltransferase [Nocardioides sp.]|nr:methyltransferase [Nocardioides sp.]
MDVATLRAALVAADYTHDAVVALLGPVAHGALARNETTPALRRTRDRSPLATLVRLFLLQAPVHRGDADRALPGLVEHLAAAGVLEPSAEEVRALVDCRPYAADDRDLWVLSDLTPGLDGAPHHVDPEHVLGVSPASTSLAQLTVRAPVGRALDLGTGCGVQALHLAQHSDRVVATDVNRRALWLAGATCALNEVDGVEVREGSLWEPVAGERFDLVATNPPFVISPPGGDRLVYRDSGLPGDEVVERIVRRAPDHLTPGGWCQVLANWAVLRDQPWDERLAGWIPEDCSALVVQRELLDPAAYVELWLKDAGQHGTPGYRERYDAWLTWLEAQGVEAVGFGWLNVRAAPGPRTFLDWPHPVEQPIAPLVDAWGSVSGYRGHRDDRLVRRDDVTQETSGPPGAADPATIVLRQQRGLRRARRVDTVEAALAGACDGELTVGQILAALADLLERDEQELASSYLPVVEELVHEGFLEPGGGTHGQEWPGSAPD